jgi:hypothetical protein
MKPPLTFEEILLLLERARMDDVSQRLRELWAEKEREVQNVRDDAAFLINRKLKESQLRSASASWIDCEGVS